MGWLKSHFCMKIKHEWVIQCILINLVICIGLSVEEPIFNINVIYTTVRPKTFPFNTDNLHTNFFSGNENPSSEKKFCVQQSMETAPLMLFLKMDVIILKFVMIVGKKWKTKSVQNQNIQGLTSIMIFWYLRFDSN